MPNSKKILVVDDVPVNIQLLVTYLSVEGYDVISAKNGHDAMKAVKEHQPDLVLLDVMMPKMNGFEVCEAIKSDDSTKFIPVILVTALNPVIGYEKGAAVAKKAYAEGRPVKDVAREMTDLSDEELDRLLDPASLTEGGIKN